MFYYKCQHCETVLEFKRRIDKKIDVVCTYCDSKMSTALRFEYENIDHLTPYNKLSKIKNIEKCLNLSNNISKIDLTTFVSRGY